MQKIDSLRAALQAALPELAGDPSRLRIWIERGAGRATQSSASAFAFAFQLNVLVIELSADIALLAHAIFRWLRTNQPALLMPGADGFSFDADILDNRTADVLVQIQLDQLVTATAKEGGGFDLAYIDQNDPVLDDFLGAGGADPVPPLAGAQSVEQDSDEESDLVTPPWEQ